MSCVFIKAKLEGKKWLYKLSWWNHLRRGSCTRPRPSAFGHLLGQARPCPSHDRQTWPRWLRLDRAITWQGHDRGMIGLVSRSRNAMIEARRCHHFPYMHIFIFRFLSYHFPIWVIKHHNHYISYLWGTTYFSLMDWGQYAKLNQWVSSQQLFLSFFSLNFLEILQFKTLETDDADVGSRANADPRMSGSSDFSSTNSPLLNLRATDTCAWVDFAKPSSLSTEEGFETSSDPSSLDSPPESIPTRR